MLLAHGNGSSAGGAAQSVLHTIFPPGGQAGTSVTVTVEGVALEGLRDLRSTIPHLIVKQTDAKHFTLNLPAETPPGVYDLRALGLHGMSSPRAFFVSNRAEYLEKEPNDALDTAQPLPLDVVINGRIDKPGDVDCYRFDARSGQRVVLECWLRARGVTLVGRSDSGVLQIIATETAPLGRQPFLRLEAVGTVEDQPVYRASRFVELEITE